MNKLAAPSFENPKIIVALDGLSELLLDHFLEAVSPDTCRLKVGKELYTKYGPSVVEKIIRKGFSVFLDLKFHDIPNTVYEACCAAADLGVWMVDVHTLGGAKMLAAAQKGISLRQSKRPLLIGVTILTSLAATDLEEIGLFGDVETHVLRLANLAQQMGLDGVVCSPQEIKTLREECGENFCLVTPGIRLEKNNEDDQVRIATPSEAIHWGADYLVIGRPITKSNSPATVIGEIIRTL